MLFANVNSKAVWFEIILSVLLALVELKSSVTVLKARMPGESTVCQDEAFTVRRVEFTIVKTLDEVFLKVMIISLPVIRKVF